MIITTLTNHLLNIDTLKKHDHRYNGFNKNDFPKSFADAYIVIDSINGRSKLVSIWVDAMSNLAIADSRTWLTSENLNDRVFLINFIELMEAELDIILSNIELSKTLLGMRLYKKSKIDHYYLKVDRLKEVLIHLRDHLKSL